MIQSINPANNSLIETFEEMSIPDVQHTIDQVQTAWMQWKETPLQERCALLVRASEVLRRRRNELARIMTLEMGKPITQSFAEIDKCALVCAYYASEAETILSHECIVTDASQSYVRFDPIGIVLAVMPWNFPFWQVFRFAAPALVAGNAGLLKHASNVTRCALSIEEVFREAGFPENLFRTLVISSVSVANVIADDRVKAVTLTGSEAAGSTVAMHAGKLLKKSVLELGGSDPFIVLEDADVDTAARTAATARCINTGQSCIAAKRFIVLHSVADRFEKIFVDEMRKKKIGDPLDPTTEIGAMAREDLLAELHDQVERSVRLGAKILCGGRRMVGAGTYYEATVLTNVSTEMPVFTEETFGPVAAVIRASDEAHAIQLANLCEFGLGASLWTKNIDLAKHLARQIESGSVFINGLVKSDPRLPFGGVKKSGYGRELSHYGLKEFVNMKTVWIA